MLYLKQPITTSVDTPLESTYFSSFYHEEIFHLKQFPFLTNPADFGSEYRVNATDVCHQTRHLVFIPPPLTKPKCQTFS